MTEVYKDENLRLVLAEQEKAIIAETLKTSRLNGLFSLLLCLLCCLFIYSQYAAAVPESQYVTIDCDVDCGESDEAASSTQGYFEGSILAIIAAALFAALTFFTFTDSLIKWLKARKLYKEHLAFLSRYNRP